MIVFKKKTTPLPPVSPTRTHTEEVYPRTCTVNSLLTSLGKLSKHYVKKSNVAFSPCTLDQGGNLIRSTGEIDLQPVCSPAIQQWISPSGYVPGP